MQISCDTLHAVLLYKDCRVWYNFVSKIASVLLASIAKQASLCRIWSVNVITDFLTLRLTVMDDVYALKRILFEVYGLINGTLNV